MNHVLIKLINKQRMKERELCKSGNKHNKIHYMHLKLVKYCICLTLNHNQVTRMQKHLTIWMMGKVALAAA